MNNDVAAEIAACLENVPGQDAGTGEVKAWLFTAQNSVAVRLRRILEDDDKTARNLLAERAGRTWGRVTKEGKAQRLWTRLSAEFLPLVQGVADGLERRVDFLPEGMLAKIFPPETTCRKVAKLCYMCCESPLAIKADLIFPYHGAWMLLPGDRTVRKWTKVRVARQYAVEVPPIGDFVAAMVMNRLGMVKELLCMLARLPKADIVLSFTPESINWEHELGEELRAVRNEIYDTPDAEERAGALALLQVYLALEEHQRGFEADWTVIPCPADDENMSGFIIDTLEQMERVPTEDRLYLPRREALGCTFDGALKDRPSEVVSIVKGGLEWLAGQLGGEPTTVGQAPPDDTPMSCAQLAAHFKIKKNALQKRLALWRDEHGDGWTEVSNPPKNKPRFHYEYGAVKGACEDAFASQQRHSEKK